MTLSWSNDFTAGYSTAAEWRKFLRLKPHHGREIAFGFLLRLVVGLVAVVVPAVPVIIIGFFNDWELSNSLIVLYGFVICAMVLFGEHLRSRAYERIISVSDAPVQFAKSYRDLTIINLAPSQREIYTFNHLIKRGLDVVLSGVGLIALTPWLLVVAVAIKFDSPGPIIIRQTRRGLDGRIFSIYKFRTMEIPAGASEPVVTSIGSLLRKSNVDELPSLLNVLIGDMSVVGPRPYALYNERFFSEEIAKYVSSLKVRPGLTGWAQIHGLRGEAKTDDLIKQRIAYDLWYVNNWTPLLDLRIIFETVVGGARGTPAKI